MKLLSVAIPCYNSSSYMNHAIETLLTGGEDMEIILVDDGSKDETLQVAKEYENRYPGIIRTIHQENGGHGEAVNTGLRNASGLYFKVVDSDDWVNEEALQKILEVLRTMVENAQSLDMLIANYVYEKVSLGKQKVIEYKGALPENCIFTWSDTGHFKNSQNIIMHSVIYRTKLLKECGLVLPSHTFYVDNIFVYYPLTYVKTMYYLNVDFYRYFIGREGQSVNEQIMMQRIDQQLKVNKIIIDCHDLTKIKCKKLRHYMVKYLVMMLTVSTVFLVKDGSEESLKKRDELWDYLKKKNKRLYHEVNKYFLGKSMQMSSRTGRKIIIIGYHISRKIYGFS
ncbi:glycosyltransferase family 2 protein [Anaeromicropila populeti]|uniref:Glycosyltransferases involved in cell wall biogenesis n=1 Tax=Anaeromicropila populeti TaxID=37658 RepID=A0A1I6I8K5_9FIRM|nr:glycosyltransferase family 2 protein [Anaeromicropila populeti]SFR63062.1 Glycosyltransferases involved in cell wall biogenesis [Anaeromicropila populeti]